MPAHLDDLFDRAPPTPPPTAAPTMTAVIAATKRAKISGLKLHGLRDVRDLEVASPLT